MPGRKGLQADNVKQACEDSLARLGTDRIDLYFAHFDDEDTPLEETFGAFDELVAEGKVLAVRAVELLARAAAGGAGGRAGRGRPAAAGTASSSATTSRTSGWRSRGSTTSPSSPTTRSHRAS